MSRFQVRTDLTFVRAHELLSYDTETGVLAWKNARMRMKAGDPAGYRTSMGYNQICVDRVKYLGHRVIWLMQTGDWPTAEIDHVNGDPSDNRWCNLREASRSGQMQNTKLRLDNRTGVKGITWDREKSKWHAAVVIDGAYALRKRFDSFGEAVEAVENARRAHHPFRRGADPTSEVASRDDLMQTIDYLAARIRELEAALPPARFQWETSLNGGDTAGVLDTHASRVVHERTSGGALGSGGEFSEWVRTAIRTRDWRLGAAS